MSYADGLVHLSAFFMPCVKLLDGRIGLSVNLFISSFLHPQEPMKPDLFSATALKSVATVDLTGSKVHEFILPRSMLASTSAVQSIILRDEATLIIDMQHSSSINWTLVGTISQLVTRIHANGAPYRLVHEFLVKISSNQLEHSNLRHLDLSNVNMSGKSFPTGLLSNSLERLYLVNSSITTFPEVYQLLKWSGNQSKEVCMTGNNITDLKISGSISDSELCNSTRQYDRCSGSCVLAQLAPTIRTLELQDTGTKTIGDFIGNFSQLETFRVLSTKSTKEIATFNISHASFCNITTLHSFVYTTGFVEFPPCEGHFWGQLQHIDVLFAKNTSLSSFLKNIPNETIRSMKLICESEDCEYDFSRFKGLRTLTLDAVKPTKFPENLSWLTLECHKQLQIYDLTVLQKAGVFELKNFSRLDCACADVTNKYAHTDNLQCPFTTSLPLPYTHRVSRMNTVGGSILLRE